jgi:hypothetical protein
MIFLSSFYSDYIGEYQVYLMLLTHTKTYDTVCEIYLLQQWPWHIFHIIFVCHHYLELLMGYA